MDDRGQADTTPWIAADEPPAFEVVNESGRGRAILVCDHASRRLPRRLGTLGLSETDRARHVAWDIGAAEVARRLSKVLDSPLILSNYSRLVIDCNRPLHVGDAFTTRSEDVDVPGNVGLDAGERAGRAEAFYWPYQDAVHRLTQARLGRAKPPAMVAVHSFTPVYLGQRRPWHVGVNYRLDRRLAAPVLATLKADGALQVGENEPYPVTLDEDYTVPVHAETRGLPYVLFEIRQDLIADPQGQTEWARRLAAVLGAALEHPSIAGLAEPATDVHEARYQPEPRYRKEPRS